MPKAKPREAVLIKSREFTKASAITVVVVGSKNELIIEINTRAAPFGVVKVLVGTWIRRRQWRRVSMETRKSGLEVNLLERIEKLDEDLRSFVTVVRVLSR
ncbi:hypothetical protein JHK87_024100 [Glycine soja]|nr:hypothetical protein JHK87_024100 [Glycine soja]